MKNLKRFEELNPETYRSAGDILGRMGFSDRKKKLHNFADNITEPDTYELYPGDFYELVSNTCTVNGKYYKYGDESFYNDDTIVFDYKFLFRNSNLRNNGSYSLTFQILINFRRCICNITKNIDYDSGVIMRKTGVKIRKNLISKMFDIIPLSEILIIRNFSSDLYLKIVDSIENINLNELCSNKDITLLRNYDFIEHKMD